MTVPLLRVCYHCGYPTPGRHATSCPDAGSGVVEVAKHTPPIEVAALRAEIASLTTERDRLREVSSTSLGPAEAELEAVREAAQYNPWALQALTVAERLLTGYRACIVERDTTHHRLVEEQRDHAVTREELADWKKRCEAAWAKGDEDAVDRIAHFVERRKLVADVERQRPVIEAAPIVVNAIEALRMLVELKDGPRDDAYYRAKDSAWAAARICLRLADKALAAAVDALPSPAPGEEGGS